MTELQYLKAFLDSLPQLSRDTGFSVAALAWSYGICRLFHGADSEEFRTMHLYECSFRTLSQYLTAGRRRKLMAKLDKGAGAEDLAMFDDKHRFNAAFRDFVRRDWLYIPESSPEQIRAFLARNDRFMVKDSSGNQGKNIFPCVSAETDPDAFLAEYAGKPYLLESFIKQHPAMAALNPSSVNTVRLVTARWDGKPVLLAGGCLRCGGSNAFVDNFHQGGVAYPLDMKTGMVTGAGQKSSGERGILLHPSTGAVMPGFTIPLWDQAVDAVCRAALVSPRMGYIGWDVAILENGVELIEGNTCPDPIVMQIDGPGSYHRLLKLMS